MRELPALQRIGSPAFKNAIRAMRTGQPVIDFLRPYSPDFIGWFRDFGQAAANYDANGHYARTLVQTVGYTAGTSSSSEVLASAPGTTYAFPRPPGLNSGETWLQPQCGAGASALDASADPEGTR